MIFAPVVIPTLCRYNHFKKLIESLQKNQFADKTDVIIGLDYPIKKEQFEGYNKIKEFLEKSISGFKSVKVFRRERNYGSLDNILDLMNYVELHYDRYIFTEDDNVFSSDFIVFMNSAIEYSKYDDSVMHVCGYSYPVKWIDDNENGILKEQSFFSGWGYGSLLSKRAIIIDFYESKRYLDCFNNIKKMTSLFYKSPKNFCFFIDGVWNHSLYSNDIGKSIYQLLENKYCLMPVKSLVKNEGWDGTGINCQDELIDIFQNQEFDSKSLTEYCFERVSCIDIKNNNENEITINNFFKPSFKMIVKTVLELLAIIVFRKTKNDLQ